jgi:hypothetical protein
MDRSDGAGVKFKVNSKACQEILAGFFISLYISVKLLYFFFNLRRAHFSWPG